MAKIGIFNKLLQIGRYMRLTCFFVSVGLSVCLSGYLSLSLSPLSLSLSLSVVNIYILHDKWFTDCNTSHENVFSTWTHYDLATGLASTNHFATSHLVFWLQIDHICAELQMGVSTNHLRPLSGLQILQLVLAVASVVASPAQPGNHT